MFTGIVEELGEVRALMDHRLVVACATVSADSPVGASMAVNGTCLTVVANDGATLAFDLSEETIARTKRLRADNDHEQSLFLQAGYIRSWVILTTSLKVSGSAAS